MTVTVVCDSPRHARGKVAKIVAFTRHVAGGWGVADPVRGRQLARGRVNMPVVTSTLVFVARSLRCKLCGQRVPESIPVDVLDALATPRGAEKPVQPPMQPGRCGRLGAHPGETPRPHDRGDHEVTVTLATLRRLIASS